MLRVMRIMRLLQIPFTSARMRFIRLYCAVRVMEPPHGIAFGAVRVIHASVIIAEIIHDRSRAEQHLGVSDRLRGKISELEIKLLQHATPNRRDDGV
jgi:hypothetical protein